MATDSAFMQERLVAVGEGESTEVGPFTVTLKSVSPVIGRNWTALEGQMEARRGAGTPFTLKPQARKYSAPPTDTSEAAISTLVDGQLYAVLGKASSDGRWQVRLWWKPMVTLIWLGGALIAFGGGLSLIGRLWRERRLPKGDAQ
jgi:cytochrome c-type biogenesis protein CcmF